ncbi:hypothetical protein DPEC_G00101280 [Dallia pectoralis]|uniref:Uncharacterized protein n=1 Tax=Dallia pectoralis TaxID=75939 RepID=A0ACC2GWQ6_DALPE|nr:hypothetical protein DPEC_G00101280 [Dallia pectoralis]
MTSVWKRLQRVGKKAAKFQFAASFQELTVECNKKWQPDKLRVVWTRRNRRHCTKLHGWQPGISNPYRGTVVWQVPENLDITVTLFKDPTADEFEDKDWTFIIENETSKGHRKVLASVDVNMKKFASAAVAQYDLTLRLKPLSAKVVEGTLKLTITCVFLREGKATDEDMQSLASLMSLKQSDIGNLDDFNDSDDEEGERKGMGPAIPIKAPTRRIRDQAWRPVIDTEPAAASDTIWSSTPGPVSNIILLPRPPMATPHGPSAPPPAPNLQSRPTSGSVGTGDQVRPSPYAYQVPAFVRAHPPALPKIFQPVAGSVPITITQQPRGPTALDHANLAEGLKALGPPTLSPSRPLSGSFTGPSPIYTLPVSSSPSSSSVLPPPTFSDIPQSATYAAARTSAWRPHSVPSSTTLSVIYTSNDPAFGTSPLSSQALPVPRRTKAYISSLAEPGSKLTRPSSLPSAPDTVPWQSEWRPLKPQAREAGVVDAPKSRRPPVPAEPVPLKLTKQSVVSPCNMALPQPGRPKPPVFNTLCPVILLLPLCLIPPAVPKTAERRDQIGPTEVRPKVKRLVSPPPELPTSPSTLSPYPVPTPVLLAEPPLQLPVSTAPLSETELHRHLSTLTEEESTTTTTPELLAAVVSVSNPRPAVQATSGPESMTPLLPFSPQAPSVPWRQCFAMQKPTAKSPAAEMSAGTLSVSTPLTSLSSASMQRVGSSEPVVTGRKSHGRTMTFLTKTSVQIGTPSAKPERIAIVASVEQGRVARPLRLTERQTTQPCQVLPANLLTEKHKEKDLPLGLTPVLKKDACNGSPEGTRGSRHLHDSTKQMLPMNKG